MNKELYKKCADMSADGIYAYLGSGAAAEDVFESGVFSCKVRDAASLYVASLYLKELPADKAAKDKLRKEAYLAFLSGKAESFPECGRLIDMLAGKTEFVSDIKMKVIKGGSYKIKNYYLENSKLQDIRGASVLLTHIEETVVPRMISEAFIPECIVYCGGGNIFAIVPESCGEDFTLGLEAEAARLLISADIAYYISGAMPLSDIFGKDYSARMTQVENCLNERKKMKINISPDAVSECDSIEISAASEYEESVTARIRRENAPERRICSACGKRSGIYAHNSECLCAACLHKRSVGTAVKRGRYDAMYSRYNHGKNASPVYTLEGICAAGNEKYIAVVYGDGNNMGGIIGRFTRITQMMEFSRDVKTIAGKAVFEAMGAHGIDRFEVAGLGGDDVFIIVDGKKAVKFTVDMIKKYNSQFEKYKAGDIVSTMSAGIAIAKYDIPIRVMIERAEEELSRAKIAAKSEGNTNGSLSFAVMDTFEGECAAAAGEVFDTLLPYDTAAAEEIIRFADSLKGKGKTKLRNILNAFRDAESTEEASLFFRYMNAKENKPVNRISLDKINGYEAENGYYIRDGRYYYIWKDILTLIDFTD